MVSSPQAGSVDVEVSISPVTEKKTQGEVIDLDGDDEEVNEKVTKVDQVIEIEDDDQTSNKTPPTSTNALSPASSTSTIVNPELMGSQILVESMLDPSTSTPSVEITNEVETESHPDQAGEIQGEEAAGVPEEAMEIAESELDDDGSSSDSDSSSEDDFDSDSDSDIEPSTSSATLATLLSKALSSSLASEKEQERKEKEEKELKGKNWNEEDVLMLDEEEGDAGTKEKKDR